LSSKTNILKAVLKHDVYPALGCTEPISVAYAASVAADRLKGSISGVKISVDPGIYKNGFAVTIPNTHGERGNLIAGVLGALVRRPDLKMELLKAVTEDHLREAREIIKAQRAAISCDKSKKRIYVDVSVRAGESTARAVMEGGHTNLTKLTLNGKSVIEKGDKSASAADGKEEDFRGFLKNTTLLNLVDMAEGMDKEDYEYIKSGIAMNMAISEAGKALGKVGCYVSGLVEDGYRVKDVFSSCEALTASAADARMSGLNMPVMASGGSGNQGIVAILVPYFVGKHGGVPEEKIVKSIGLSHLVNSYIKCFTGDLSPLCGCAIAAGVGAAAAIVYQHTGKDEGKIALAVNNLVSDLGGMLCDGAKEGCALKVASSTNSAIRSAYMALSSQGITQAQGFVGATAEDTIKNLSRISIRGMSLADDTMLGIMADKTASLKQR